MDIIDYSLDQRKVCEDVSKKEWYGELEDKPEIERQLFGYQEKYYDNTISDEERQNTWLEMMTLVHRYANSLVKQKLKNRKFLPPDIIEDYTNLATINFMSQYIYRPNFKCGASFGKMINYKVVEAVYGKKQDEQIQSLSVSTLDKDTDLTSMQVAINAEVLFSHEDEDDPEDIKSEHAELDFIRDILYEFDSEITNQLLQLKSRMYLQLVIRHPKNRHVKEQFIKHICKNKQEIDVVQLLELELYKRCSKCL